MSISMMRKAGLFCALLVVGTASKAEVRLPHMFSAHAVLQRNQPVHIWGWAAPGEKVTVEFHAQKRDTVANQIGLWEVSLMPETAGGPYTLTVNGDQTAKPVESPDIMVGDVWVASGQSNMAFPLKGFPTAPLNNGEQELSKANQPRIRLLNVAHAVSDSPVADITGEWTDCTPATAADFSAVAYFFGREVSEHEKVTVGLIDSTWGGTPAQSWVSMDALATANYSPVLADGANVAQENAYANQVRANFATQNAALAAQGKPVLKVPRFSGNSEPAHFPSALFNGMISPLTGYTIKGVIWYQGESDAVAGTPRPGNYSRLFPLLITDWRHHWGEGDFPFLFVQLSSFKAPRGEWGQVRDAQRRTLVLKNTGMAVTLDVGSTTTIHPPDKQTVGARLALAALGGVYGDKIVFASPEFLEATPEGNAIRVWFTDATGLNTRGKPVGGFEVAGKDHVFASADAKIEQIGGQPTVNVSAPNIPAPLYVRYGYSNYVTDYLYNSAGLPLATFTSE